MDKMNIKFACFFLIVFAFLSSCVTHKNLLELQTKTNDSIIIPNQRLEYMVQKGDILDIRVSSLDPQSVAIFNKTIGQSANNQINEATVYLNGYVISDSGAISLPLIGNITVFGLSIEEIKSLIEEKMSPYFKFYSVDVKLMNFRVTILGEVNKPGTHYVYNERSNIFQLIGVAGGITDFGNRKKVRIIRKQNDESKLVYLDITSSDLISSQFYYLQPNDVIYVEPIKAKAVRANAGTTQIVLGVLTFVIVLLNLVTTN
jgi:polysaccharide biosynthesis/export protein